MPAPQMNTSPASRFGEAGRNVSAVGPSETVTSGPLRNEDTGEELYFADFSALKEPGTYFLDIPGVGRGAPIRGGGGGLDAAVRAALAAQ